MSGVWSTAEQIALHQSRRFVDWEAFWSGEWVIKPDDHKLFLGAQRSVYDACCHRQICDISLAPYPSLSVIGPYLKLISRGHDEPPHIDHDYLIHRRAPLYFDRVYTTASQGGTLTYVDLRAAYWAIYTRGTLDLSYDGESVPRNGQIRFIDRERLGEDRIVRNALLGSLRRERRRGIDHGQYFVEEVSAGVRRPDLWGLVMDCLEVVMWTARDLGAVYIHTDGAIFPHPDLAEDWIAKCRLQFNLEATIRAHGEGWVNGLGRFRIGDEVHGAENLPGNRVDSMLEVRNRNLLTEWLYHASLIDAPGENSLAP